MSSSAFECPEQPHVSLGAMLVCSEVGLGRDFGRLRRCCGHVRLNASEGSTMKPRRRKPKRTQLERRNETQAAVLSASIDLLAEHGYAGFSASRVARRAGVSRGAQEHYFPKKNDLIAAATQHAMREAVEHARSLARSANGAADPVAKFLTDSEHFFFRPVFRAMIEIMIAARSERSLALVVNPIVLDARQVLNGIWIETL